MDLLKVIADLSHEFGTADYVCGGGGNTSAKTDDTIWIKPSGTQLGLLSEDSFVPMDREKLFSLYKLSIPSQPDKRELLVKEVMASAVKPPCSARASVESPLHNILSRRFVVHTHPAVVNGMTCAQNGRKICEELFPSALWLDYIDPGYTLCVEASKAIQEYKIKTGSEPEVIFLKNHGLFVSSDDDERVRTLYQDIFEKLKAQYRAANISTKLKNSSSPDNKRIESALGKIQYILGSDYAAFIVAEGLFDYAEGPISPDHIVYAKSFPYIGQPSDKGIKQYRDKYNCEPNILVFDDAVFAVGTTEKKANLALQLAKDAGLVKQLAKAFGGICYMDRRASDFIENWEVEAYRSKQI